MNKTVLITGARRGLGLALTKQFISNRWNVLSVIRNDKGINELKELPNCIPIISDITSDEVQSTIHESLKENGAVDVLINNAGIPGSGAHLDETIANEVLSLIDVHCIGAFRVTQAVLPFLSKDGVVINVSSRFGSISKVSKGELDNVKCSYSYRIAKAAQNMLTQCLCREFKDKGIRICSIHPGRLTTEIASSDADRTAEEAAKKLFSMLELLEHGKFYSLFEDIIEW